MNQRLVRTLILAAVMTCCGDMTSRADLFGADSDNRFHAPLLQQPSDLHSSPGSFSTPIVAAELESLLRDPISGQLLSQQSEQVQQKTQFNQAELLLARGKRINITSSGKRGSTVQSSSSTGSKTKKKKKKKASPAKFKK